MTNKARRPHNLRLLLVIGKPLLAWAVALSCMAEAVRATPQAPAAGKQSDPTKPPAKDATQRKPASLTRVDYAKMQDRWAPMREQLVKHEILGAGIKSPPVLDAIRMTPRHEFIPSKLRRYAYFDMNLPIGEAQTITSPYTVAYMTEQLDPQPTDKVLEIGTGSGYQAAVLSCLVAEVYSMEIVEELGKRAAETLTRLGYDNIKTKIGDGYQGWAEHAPFDKIIVTCSPEDIPQPLVDQLKDGGRLVVPLGERYQQTMCLFGKADGRLTKQRLDPTLFVPMTGQAEVEREVQADPDRPVVVNGDFEEASGKQPVGWYYMRQASIENDPGKGNRYLALQNSEPGRTAMAIQAVGIDGRHGARWKSHCASAVNSWRPVPKYRSAPDLSSCSSTRIAIRRASSASARGRAASTGPISSCTSKCRATHALPVLSWGSGAVQENFRSTKFASKSSTSARPN